MTLTEDGDMRVTFLGTGTSHGIPMIGCDCAVCRSDDPRNKRLRASILVEDGGTTLLVDATPDFRTQALRAGIRNIDAVLITHTHADHVLGLDDLRAFTERSGRAMPVYGSAQTLADIQRVFPYACTDKPSWVSLPRFDLRTLNAGEQTLIGNTGVRVVEVSHGRAKVFGFVFGERLVYLTDCSVIAPDVVQSMKGISLLVLDGLRHRPHPAHLTIEAAVEVAGRIGAKLTLLTHLCHEVDHVSVEKTLPAGVRVAYDGLRVEIEQNEIRKMA